MMKSSVQDHGGKEASLHEKEMMGEMGELLGREPRETTARLISRGEFFCFTNGWDSQRSLS